MPLKNEFQQEKKNKLGTPNNTLKMGIIGMANVGKSTTFNILSKLNVLAEKFPFCTIDPNYANVPVQDERFNKLCQMHKPKSQIQAVLSIVDIAGLIPGAYKGEGLGNAFLQHIKECDGIYHVVRAFEDDDVCHTELSVDPIRDMDIISNELIEKDLEFCNNRLAKIENLIKQNKNARKEKEVLDKVKQLLEFKIWVRTGDWNLKEVEILNNYSFITAKNIVYLVNLSQQDFITRKNKWLKGIKDWVDGNCPGDIIPYCADLEKDIQEESLVGIVNYLINNKFFYLLVIQQEVSQTVLHLYLIHSFTTIPITTAFPTLEANSSSKNYEYMFLHFLTLFLQFYQKFTKHLNVSKRPKGNKRKIKIIYVSKNHQNWLQNFRFNLFLYYQ